MKGCDSHAIFERRLDLIRAREALCHRRELLYRRRSKLTIKIEPEGANTSLLENKKPFSLRCKLRQCIFCIGNDSLPHEQRIFEYKSTTKRMDESESHLDAYRECKRVSCPHPKCRESGLSPLPSIMAVKAHVKRIHNICFTSR